MGNAMKQTDGRILFVYYKVGRPNDDKLLDHVRTFQRRLKRQWPGLECELMHRPAESSETHNTWLEIYRHADGMADQMIEEISRLAHDLELPSPRHGEVFTPFK